MLILHFPSLFLAFLPNYQNSSLFNRFLLEGKTVQPHSLIHSGNKTSWLPRCQALLCRSFIASLFPESQILIKEEIPVAAQHGAGGLLLLLVIYSHGIPEIQHGVKGP